MLVKRCGTAVHCDWSSHCELYRAKPGVSTQTFYPTEVGEHCHNYVAKQKSDFDITDKLASLMGAHA